MGRMLSVSRAARLAGVSRCAIQQQIRRGDLTTFEGMVELGDLQKVYPDVEPENNASLERLARLQENAIGKFDISSIPNEHYLVEEINRMRNQIATLESDLEFYHDTIALLQQKLTEVQEGCDRKQRLMLQALASWMAAKVEHH